MTLMLMMILFVIPFVEICVMGKDENGKSHGTSVGEASKLNKVLKKWKLKRK